MTDLYSRLKDRLEQHVAQAEAIAAKADADGRTLTTSEDVLLQQHMDDIKELGSQLKIAKADARVRQQLSELGDDVAPGALPGGSVRSLYGGSPATSGFKTAGSSWAQRVAGQVAGAASSYGVKAITLGGFGIPAPVEPTVVLPSQPHRLLDLVPVRALGTTSGPRGTTEPSNEYSYPKQTARTPNVTTVADGATKSTSVYTFEEVIDRARVIAHLSEPIPLRYFEDHADLQGILDSQMRDDLLTKIEGLIAAGTGTGEDWLGILGTSGIRAQVWVADLVTTLRKARTILDVWGEQPTAWVFNPTDIERLDLLADDNGRYYGADINALLGNLPRVPSSSVPAGTGLLGDFRMSRLFVRAEATLDVDRSGPDLFDKNLAKLRVEMRAGFGVLRPGAFVSVGLTA